MPRFYFDLQHESDERGSDLPDAEAARLLARRYAGELLRDHRTNADLAYWRMDVRQGSGPVLFSLVLELVPGKAASPKVAPGRRRLRHAGDDYV